MRSAAALLLAMAVVAAVSGCGSDDSAGGSGDPTRTPTGTPSTTSVPTSTGTPASAGSGKRIGTRILAGTQAMAGGAQVGVGGVLDARTAMLSVRPAGGVAQDLRMTVGQTRTVAGHRVTLNAVQTDPGSGTPAPGGSDAAVWVTVAR